MTPTERLQKDWPKLLIVRRRVRLCHTWRVVMWADVSGYRVYAQRRYTIGAPHLRRYWYYEGAACRALDRALKAIRKAVTE